MSVRCNAAQCYQVHSLATTPMLVVSKLPAVGPGNIEVRAGLGEEPLVNFS